MFLNWNLQFLLWLNIQWRVTLTLYMFTGSLQRECYSCSLLTGESGSTTVSHQWRKLDLSCLSQSLAPHCPMSQPSSCQMICVSMACCQSLHPWRLLHLNLSRVARNPQCSVIMSSLFSSCWRVSRVSVRMCERSLWVKQVHEERKWVLLGLASRPGSLFDQRNTIS